MVCPAIVPHPDRSVTSMINSEPFRPVTRTHRAGFRGRCVEPKTMTNMQRRNMLRAGLAFVAMPGATLLSLGCGSDPERVVPNSKDSTDAHAATKHKKPDPAGKGNMMQVHYLEFVTPDVDAVCATYARLHGVTFADADPNLGGARTAKLADGGILGIRAPLRDTEAPVVRPYFLVQDIKASVAAAADSGAKVALPPTELAGHGTCAIVIQGGIESGLWQL